MGNAHSNPIIKKQKQQLNKQLLDEVKKEKPNLTEITNLYNYGANLNFKEDFIDGGYSPLLWASNNGNMEIVDFLLNKDIHF